MKCFEGYFREDSRAQTTRGWRPWLLPFRNLFATPKNNNLPPSAFSNDSRLRLALAAQNKHTMRRYNISARVPGGNGGIWAHFFFFHPYKKCAKITSVPPGPLADMLYLRVVCLFCAASPRQRRESSPSRWWQVVVFGLWQTNSETAIIISWCFSSICINARRSLPIF